MKLRLDTGEDAEARTFDGALLTLLSPRPFAPGAPIRFTATSEGDLRSFEGRVLGSKRVDDAHFEVRMRFVNLRRHDREILADRVGH
ncbi:MAG: hypothetical protein JRG67_05785 [Deltaproteobacteria bacterium]|nr:hypothetical protein [Deltaproteobacteria bacterium]MBW2210545.1 hypothetical protein [Deltaproteobacteria bacterium]MBW2214717.1 hypothetical protein [Deltaproteobacteria bacterium]MBW2550160.1 hypothetical protein [Deltaproteobacteria bacterium]MBW2626833.1 hypothetical protein [Deltaproteobacteria bacterium]